VHSPLGKLDCPQAIVDMQGILVDSCLGKVRRHCDRGTPEGGVVLYEWRHFVGESAPFATSNTSYAQVIHHLC